jgi:hypothetical protein
MKTIAFYLLLVFLPGYCIAQTNPAVQFLPLTFNAQTGSTLPAGVAVHRFGTTAAAIPTTRTLIPGNADLPYNSGGTSGGWRDEGTNGIGLLASGSQAAGAVVVAINTIGQSAIQVGWTIRTILQQTSRDNSIALQYRIGNIGNFIDVGTSSTYSSTGQTAGLFASFTETLPAAAENQAEVQIRWIYWESNGTAGSRDRLAVDDISITAGTVINTIGLSAGTNPAEPSTDGNFSLSFTPATSSPISLDYTLTGSATFTTDYGITLSTGTPSPFASANGSITIPSGTNSITITVSPNNDIISEGIETILLSISNATGGYTISTSSAAINLIDDEATRLSSIQGSGTTATPGIATIEGIVTGVYPNLSPAGFYLQEEDTDADSDPATSEAIFVVSPAAVAVGDLVTVTGTVQENGTTPSFNQAVVVSPTVVNIISSGNPLPALTDIALPITSTAFLERYEGMLVRYPYTLTVTDNTDLSSFGELSLARNGLVFQPTQSIDPNDNPATGTTFSGNSNVAAVTASANANALRTILLDDGRNGTPTSLPYINADNTLRIGATIDNLTGILGFGFSRYRTQPLPPTHPYATPVFVPATRPTVPSVGATANLKIASFNVLNYFNGDGLGGGFPTARGADNLAEFNRQRDKIINAISQIDADLIGLIEIENDGTGSNSAIQDLVNGLNAAMGAGTYSFINDGATSQSFNTDLIRCGILYKPAVLTAVGAVMTSNNATFDRPPLAHNFQLISTRKEFNFIVNHFKSKGGCPGSGIDADQSDGQACWNDKRKNQSLELVNFINTTVLPTSGNNRIVSVGDYNAYFEEDPMDVLRANNLQVLSSNSSFSFSFNGQLGSLDHAVISNALSAAVTGIEKWNINSAEPSYLDYNDGPRSSTYTISPWRSSDHDPVLIGLNLTNATLPVSLTDFTAVKKEGAVSIQWKTASEINSKEFTIERSADGLQFAAIGAIASANNASGAVYSFTDNNPGVVNYYRLKMIDKDGKFSYSKSVLVVFEKKTDVLIAPNPAREFVTIRNSTIQQPALVQLMNANGQIVLQQHLQNNNTVLSLKGFPAGIYYVNLRSDKKVIIQKLLVH